MGIQFYFQKIFSAKISEGRVPALANTERPNAADICACAIYLFVGNAGKSAVFFPLALLYFTGRLSQKSFISRGFSYSSFVGRFR